MATVLQSVPSVYKLEIEEEEKKIEEEAQVEEEVDHHSCLEH